MEAGPRVVLDSGRSVVKPLPRASGGERMDEPDVDRRELANGLADLRAVNRWLGGTRVVLRHLRPMLRRLEGREVRVLDVATGSADVPLAVAREARSRGMRVRVVATDVHPATLEEARRRTADDPDVEVAEADALSLPFEGDAFDVALCCTALHHFEGDDAVRVVRELDRVSRAGWIVSDLRRTRAALLGAKLMAATLWRRHPVTRHDGPLSVRRAWTPEELDSLAREAGVRATVRRHGPLRVALVADRTREEDG